VSPETAQFVAVIVVICAVLVAGGTTLMVRAASRNRAGLVQRREAVERSAVRVSRESAELRDRMEHVTRSLERMRVDGTSWERDMQRWTGSLREQRASIERMTQGRLASIIRMARVVSKAAQVAFLWR